MKAMTYKGYAAKIAFEPEDRILIGRIAGIADVIGFHANDGDGIWTAFQEAVDDYLATCEKVGKMPQKPYSGNVMLRISPDLHADVALAADLAGKSINAWGEQVLRDAVSH